MLTDKSTVSATAAYLKSRISGQPLVGIILGTGLNALAERIASPVVFTYDQIPDFPLSTVSFHKGRLIYGLIGKTPVVVMQGRFHYYEGYSMQQITFPVRVMKALGVEFLFVSNAAGGMNPGFKKGDLVIAEDHINLLPDNPLRGIGNQFGNYFVDMSAPYDRVLRSALENAFLEAGIPVKSGIYVAVMGPNLETRAEYRWLRNMGADMVGMSTVPEVIVANQEGIACVAVSVITDECDPDNLKPVNIEEIIAIAGEADKTLSNVFFRVIENL